MTTYEYATENAELIERLEWNIVVFEEAHRLSKPENKTTIALKNATGDAFKLLLTATPMQNSIMDLYGLIEFIEPGALGDADEFYKRYFRKPENYGELTATANRYCFRTLRSQVESYVKIPRRFSVTADYPLSVKETKLAELVETYLKKPDKAAFPKMESYDLSLMFNRALSSSPWALAGLADKAHGRAQEPELSEMAALASEIQPAETGKGQALLKTLKLTFSGLKKHGANQKAIIFTESLSTIGFLHVLLSKKYKTLVFDGSKSSDYSVIKKFETEADVLITTDIVAEGFNLAFCSFVVNFDLPYNVLTMEQRIMRCHRQGQENDVVVLNFLNKQNFADVRMLELINKRVLQFDGIMGMSDDLVGSFIDSAVDGITAAFGTARHKKDIEAEFQATLIANEMQNINKVQEAENSLFTTFTRDIADKITITPQYIKDRTVEFNEKLWEITVPLLEKYGYIINEAEQTATLPDGADPPHLFYYWTGSRNSPYKGLKKYGSGNNFKPVSGRVTLASPIGRGVIENIECADEGVVIASNEELEGKNCKLALYEITVSEKGKYAEYTSLVGRTANDRILNEDECRALMDLTVLDFTEVGRRAAAWLKGSTGRDKPHELDSLLDIQKFKDRAVMEINDARLEESAAINERARREKSLLNHEVESLKNELRQIENAMSRTGAVKERVEAEKRRATASKSLKSREQTLFMDGMKIDAEAIGDRAEYGKQLIKYLSERLTGEFGEGFTAANLRNMRQFYLTFEKRYALRSELSWTHYRLLMRIEDDNRREFYLNECADESWSTRQLERQINSFFYERLLATQKEHRAEIESEIQTTVPKTDPDYILRDPYILEFLELKENAKHKESEIEQGLIDKLQEFLMELGKGFSLAARQKRITTDGGEHYYIDLVFYNYILKCFVVIDLKAGKLTYQDIGQIDFYVRLFDDKMKQPDDNPTIGLILCADKDESIVKYSVLSDNENLFASKYKLYLPTEEELKRELERERWLIEQSIADKTQEDNDNE